MIVVVGEQAVAGLICLGPSFQATLMTLHARHAVSLGNQVLISCLCSLVVRDCSWCSYHATLCIQLVIITVAAIMPVLGAPS